MDTAMKSIDSADAAATAASLVAAREKHDA